MRMMHLEYDLALLRPRQPEFAHVGIILGGVVGVRNHSDRVGQGIVQGVFGFDQLQHDLDQLPPAHRFLRKIGALLIKRRAVKNPDRNAADG